MEMACSFQYTPRSTENSSSWRSCYDWQEWLRIDLEELSLIIVQYNTQKSLQHERDWIASSYVY